MSSAQESSASQDCGGGLSSISHIEGDAHKISPKLLADLRSHFANGGSDDFSERRWKDDQCLRKIDSRAAAFYPYNRSSTKPLLASRYAYKTDRQIIVVRIPASKGSKAYAAIVIPIQNTPALQGFGENKWHAYPWLIWMPIHMRGKGYGNRSRPWQVVRAIENKAGATSYAPRIPYKRLESGSSVGTSTSSNSWHSSTSSSIPSDNSDDPEVGMAERLMLPQQELPVKDTAHQGTNYASNSNGKPIIVPRGSEQHELYKLRFDSRGASLAADERNLAKSQDFLKFVFKDQNDIIQGEAYISECTSAAELFDHAYEAEIVEKHTRMLEATIGNGKTMPMMARREETFIKLVQHAKDLTENGQVIVVVKMCY